MTSVAWDSNGPSGSPSAGVSGTTSPLSWTHTLGGSANAILVCVANAGSAANNVTSVTIGSSNTNIPLLGTSTNSQGALSEWYGLLSPPTGAQTVKVNFSGTPSDMEAGSVAFTGANSFGTVYAANNGAGNSASQTVAVSSTTSGGMVAVTCSYGGAGFSSFACTGSGGTVQLSDPASSSFAGGMNAIGTYASTGSAMTVGLSVSGGTDVWTVAAVEVVPAVFAVTTTSLTEGSVGDAYSDTLTEVNGATPVSWSVTAGSLPGWASLNSSTGAITGTPTSPPGTSSFTVTCTDNASNTATASLVLAWLTPMPLGSAIPGVMTPGLVSPEFLAQPPGPSPGTDSASAADGGEQVIVRPASGETGTGAEPSAVLKAIAAADSGHGTDGSEAVRLASSDVSSGQDSTGAVTAFPSGTEAASGADGNEKIGVRPVSGDSATGTDGGEHTIQGTHDADTATGSDAAASVTATLSGQSDPGTGAEAAGLRLASADTGSALEGQGLRVPDADSAAGTDASGGTAVVPAAAGEETGHGADAQALTARPADGDSGSGTELTGLTAHVSDADSATGTDGGEGGTGGGHKSDSDYGHGEDSGFAFPGSADACSCSDGNEQVRQIDADACAGDDEPTRAWPHDADSATAADNSSSWPHDTDACTASEDWQKTRTFTDADSGSGLDDEHHQVEVFSYQPDFRWTGGGYELVWVVPDGDGGFAGVTVWRGPVPDAGVYRLAQQLHEAAPSAHVHDSDQVTARHEHAAPYLGTAIHAGRALTVTVEVRA